ncbi:type II toxin-antitoxin system VapC family toxin [Roseibacillus persicicus]|nr:type II toxin-antitoxin system VapC family toxin [Roseibacillus persicicus]MDQ8191696.1 type II toxin-antitoxin system VapC family toxin [Roseibacillus persicicus]
MTEGETAIADANLFLGAFQGTRANHDACLHLMEQAEEGHFRLLVSNQILREVLVVSTRPRENNGLGATVAEAIKNQNVILSICLLLPEDDAVAETLHDLVAKYDLKGKRIHDANIAATALRHGFTKILTANPKDFAKISEIEVVPIPSLA